MSIDRASPTSPQDDVTESLAKRRAFLSFQWIGPVAALVDLTIIVTAAVLSAYVYHLLFLGSAVGVARYVAIGGICFLNFATIGGARKAYQIDALLQFRRQVREVVMVWTLVAMLSLSLIFVAKVAGDISRGAVALFFLTGLLTLLGWRRLLGLWIAEAIETGALSLRKVILIADLDELVRTDAVRRISSSGYSPTLTLTYGPNPSSAQLRDLANEVILASRDQTIDSVMLIADWAEDNVIDQIVTALRVLPLSVHLLPDHRTARLIPTGTSTIAGLVAAQVQRAPLSTAERAVKRGFDVAFSITGLVLLSPLLATVAVLIKFNSQGPVLFRQTRNGFSGQPFRVLKFRTMTVTEDREEFRQAVRGDDRITRLGGWLRRTSIDELPQLWNVLRGDMSIVGPRPHPTALNEAYQTRIGSYAFRHHVKPGLTGWAQVNGLRGDTSTLARMERRVEHDLYYINNWSLLLDLLIVLLTVRVVFRDPSAF